MNNNSNMANAALSANRLLPAFQAPEHLDVYDIRSASKDIQLSVTTLTGVINRQQPKVYLLGNDDDAFWLNEVFSQIPHDVSPAKDADALSALLNSYGSRIRGLIIYDPNCMDSINVATMLAGQRDSIVVSPALAQALRGQPYQLPVVADLRIYQWKNRIQAYGWAERNLLKSSSPNLVAGIDPMIPSALRSFLVATRTFVYWLDARNALPNVQNRWISERRLMQRILNAFPAGTIHLGWFVDEGQGIRLTSKAAIPMLASDHFFNLEVWTSIRNVRDEAEGVDQERGLVGEEGLVGASPARPSSPAESSSLARPPSPAGSITAPSTIEMSTGKPKAYVSFTISDGDNLQYDQHRMVRLWRDPARGTIPIGWTISPALLRVTPVLAGYYMRTATPNDELIAGPSGAAYMLPSHWPSEHLPAFLQRTGELMQSMNLSVLEVLDSGSWMSMALINQGLQQQYVEALARYGVQGILSGAGQAQPGWRIIGGVPVLQNLGLANNVDKAVSLVRNASMQSTHQASPLFLNVYILAWSMTPSDLKRVIQQLGSEYEVVTPGRLFALIIKGNYSVA